MAIELVPTAVVAVCDGCSLRQVIEDPDIDDVHGIQGDVREINTMGGSANAKWFACKPSCIRKAVEAALNRAWGRNE